MRRLSGGRSSQEISRRLQLSISLQIGRRMWMLLRGLNPKSIGGHCVDIKFESLSLAMFKLCPKKGFEAPSIFILDLMLDMVFVKMGSIRYIFLQFKKIYSCLLLQYWSSWYGWTFLNKWGQHLASSETSSLKEKDMTSKTLKAKGCSHLTIFLKPIYWMLERTATAIGLLSSVASKTTFSLLRSIPIPVCQRQPAGRRPTEVRLSGRNNCFLTCGLGNNYFASTPLIFG